jgi:hypothetical protein
MLKPDFMIETHSRGTLEINPQFANMDLYDIMQAAQIPMQVVKIPTYYKDPISGEFIQSKGFSVIDLGNSKELGFGFTDKYVPVNYYDALQQFFGDVKKVGGIPTRAINFNGGEKIAMQFVLPNEWKVADSPHKYFTNFYSSHNGEVGNTFNESDICVVCGNTYRRSLADKTLKSVARHTSKVMEKIDEISKIFINAEKNAELHYQFLNKLASQNANSEVVKQFTTFLMPDAENNNPNRKKSDARENRREELIIAIEKSANERNSGEITWYDLFQGVTRYTNYRTQKRNNAEQFEYVMAGNGNTVNQAGYNWLMENYAK